MYVNICLYMHNVYIGCKFFVRILFFLFLAFLKQIPCM